MIATVETGHILPTGTSSSLPRQHPRTMPPPLREATKHELTIGHAQRSSAPLTTLSRAARCLPAVLVRKCPPRDVSCSLFSKAEVGVEVWVHHPICSNRDGRRAPR